jgi:hypothetical protein
LYEADKRKREILKAIEENLIAVRLWNLTHADKEEAIGDDQPVLPEGEPMPPGTRCTVELEMKGKSEFVEATIIHWEGMAAGTYRVILNDGRRLSLKPKNIKWVNDKEPETELDYQGKEAING